MKVFLEPVATTDSIMVEGAPIEPNSSRLRTTTFQLREHHD
jgi:hypothetical protein